LTVDRAKVTASRLGHLNLWETTPVLPRLKR